MKWNEIMNMNVFSIIHMHLGHSFVRSFVRKEYKDFKIEYSIYTIFFTYYVIHAKWRRSAGVSVSVGVDSA